jgi:hypothetical protein
MADIKTIEDVKIYMKRKLGFPQVRVELTDDQMEDAVDDALRKFNRHLFVKKTNFHAESSTDQFLQLDDDVIQVTFVNFLLPQYAQEYANVSVFEIMTRMVYPASMDIAEWYTTKMYYQMFQKIRGADPTWSYNPDSNLLVFDLIGGPWTIFYCTSNLLSVDSILTKGRRRYKEDFLELCLAYAKQTMSLIRGKFGGIPSPGGTLQMDADKLDQQAQEVIARVEQKLLNVASARMLPIIS